ncbi:MAG: YraN family protein [Granulosicoccus sp.]
MQKKQVGDRAEKLALSWLESKGYQLIQSNYARRVGEIDLIVRHPDGTTIVFVEVRYRSSEQYGGALFSVNHIKQQRLIRTANSWLQRHASEHDHARIDVIALRPATSDKHHATLWQDHEIDWVKNAVEE